MEDVESSCSFGLLLPAPFFSAGAKHANHESRRGGAEGAAEEDDGGGAG